MSVNNVENGNNVTSVVSNMIDDKNRDLERGKVYVRVGESLRQATSMTPAALVPVQSTHEVVVNLGEGEEDLVDGTLPGAQGTGDTRGGCTNASARCQTVARFLRRLTLIMLLITIITAILAYVALYAGKMFLLQLLIVIVVAYFVAGGRFRWCYVALRTLPRDTKAISKYLKVLWQIRSHEKKNRTVSDIFRQHVARHPNKACFIYELEEWTFQQVEDFSNKIATTFKTYGYRKGDVIALLMENRPEFVAIWLGLSKLGIVTSLINTNLRKLSLLHSLEIAKCQALIFSSDLYEAVADIAGSLNSNVTLYRYGNQTAESATLKAKDLMNILSKISPAAPSIQEKSSYRDELLYIYTSGTTGLPKAAVITNSRFMFIAIGIGKLAGMRSSDILYTPLPLYHTAGGVMSVGQSLLYGNTTVIRKKFSASSYFNDCIRYKCTIAQYIGEMCRYILAVPPKPEEKNHNLRMIFGNGLRPHIWLDFVARFNIPKVVEFYGATEGNANIVNIDNTVGAIGFISRIIPSVYPISIIKVNDEGKPLRDAKGLCQVCGPGEPGVFVGKIIPNNPSRAFLGYVDQKASESKVVRDVFAKGDSAFLSGDILVANELGYLYFKDRTGDTFRWKGENVSTSEIEGIISNLVNYKDCIVYGVEVPNAEGRAGMVAIYDGDGVLNIDQLSNDIKEHLPFYARPQFLRILTKIDLTGTFKLKKKDLQEEGFDPAKIEDKLYYLDSKTGYQFLSSEIFDDIHRGRIKL